MNTTITNESSIPAEPELKSDLLETFDLALEHREVLDRRHLIALDVDGTLVTPDGNMSDELRDAVAAVDAAGHEVVIATGRSIASTLPILYRLNLTEGYAVCSNGALTLRLNPNSEKGFDVLERVTFDPEPALRRLHEHIPTALFAVEDDIRGFRVTAPFPGSDISGRQQIVPFDDLCSQPVCRMIAYSTELTNQDFQEIIDQVGLREVSYAIGWTAWIDIMPDGVTKASGLEKIRQQRGIPTTNTLAIGDGRNDIEMLQWAADGVAMGIAPPEVRAAANRSTTAVEDDGAAKVLREFMRDWSLKDGLASPSAAE